MSPHLQAIWWMTFEICEMSLFFTRRKELKVFNITSALSSLIPSREILIYIFIRCNVGFFTIMQGGWNKLAQNLLDLYLDNLVKGYTQLSDSSCSKLNPISSWVIWHWLRKSKSSLKSPNVMMICRFFSTCSGHLIFKKVNSDYNKS